MEKMKTLDSGAISIGAPFGLTGKQVYHLAESNPDFPSFKVGEGRRAKLFAFREDIAAWFEDRAQRSRQARGASIN